MPSEAALGRWGSGLWAVSTTRRPSPRGDPARWRSRESRKHFGQFAKFGNALSSSVGNVLGLPIAIDFGTGSLKILQVAAGDPPVLVAAASLETPTN